MSAGTYPVRVDASLDSGLSRWLWLVKWVLAIPHFVVLGFLWIAFTVLSIVAFFAILFTGRYPRAVFDFNVGVLRWTWRVLYYSYGALGTDRYPPFSLAEHTDYPAHLQVEYPGRLSRGLVLVKWWLLAIPHYIIVGLFVGGTYFGVAQADRHGAGWADGGLIGFLVLVAAVVLLFTGRYPEPIFGFVLGMNRWVLRVAAYAGLMTDEYPPFRLDQGGTDPAFAGPGGVRFQEYRTNTPPAPGGAGSPVAPGLEPPGPPAASRPPATGWTTGRVISLVAGSVLILAGTGLLAGGAGALATGASHRVDGYVTSSGHAYQTAGRALVTETVTIPGNGVDKLGRDLVGAVRIRVTPEVAGRQIFVGLAKAGAAARYLSGVRYTTVHDIGSATPTRSTKAGTATPVIPGRAGIWAVQSAGAGTRTLTTHLRTGNWAVVVMNRDAAAGLAVRADIGAKLPALSWFSAGLLISGALILAAGILLIVVPVRRAGATPASGSAEEKGNVNE
jgi:Domain of unknown function (DUF4389)